MRRVRPGRIRGTPEAGSAIPASFKHFRPAAQKICGMFAIKNIAFLVEQVAAVLPRWHLGQPQRQGTPIGDMDTQIAAHALTEDLILVTHNIKHFDKAPDLKLQDRTGLGTAVNIQSIFQALYS